MIQDAEYQPACGIYLGAIPIVHRHWAIRYYILFAFAQKTQNIAALPHPRGYNTSIPCPV